MTPSVQEFPRGKIFTGCAGLVAICVVAAAAIAVLRAAGAGPYSLTPLPKWAISRAFDGKSNPLENPKLEIECGGFDCEEVIPNLPAVSRVSCVEDLGPVGACYHVQFGEKLGSEVHVWWTGYGRYRILLKRPVKLTSGTDRSET